MPPPRLVTTNRGHYSTIELILSILFFSYQASFRQLFVSLEIEAEIDPTTVAATLGHSTPITTMSTYSHYFADSKRRASNIIADIIEGKTAG